MPEPVRVEIQPRLRPQPRDQVIGRRIRPRLPPRLRPDVDEHVVAVDIAVLKVQVVGIQPDQLTAGRDRPAARLGAGAVRVLPGHDANLPLRGSFTGAFSEMTRPRYGLPLLT